MIQPKFTRGWTWQILCNYAKLQPSSFSLFHLYGRQIIVCWVFLHLFLHLFESAVSVLWAQGLVWEFSSARDSQIPAPHSSQESTSLCSSATCMGSDVETFFISWLYTYSQLCVPNHFPSQCCCRELRGTCLGDTKACEHPSSVWGFTKDDIPKRGKPSLLEQSAGDIWWLVRAASLPEDRSEVVLVLVGISN